MASRRLPPGLRRSVNRQAEHVLRTGRRFTRFDQLRQRHFWSSHMFIPDVNGYIQAGNFPVFVTPAGQNGQGFPSGIQLTERETNWKSQNRVPDNQNFEITEIGVSIDVPTPSTTGLADGAVDPDELCVEPRVLYQALNNTLVSITYLTNSVPLGLCADFAQPAGAQQGQSTINGGVLDGTFFRGNGFSAPALRRRFKIPILLQHGETFSFTYNIPRSFFVGSAGGQPAAFQSSYILRFDFWATESFVEKS